MTRIAFSALICVLATGQSAFAQWRPNQSRFQGVTGWHGPIRMTGESHGAAILSPGFSVTWTVSRTFEGQGTFSLREYGKGGLPIWKGVVTGVLTLDER